MPVSFSCLCNARIIRHMVAALIVVSACTTYVAFLKMSDKQRLTNPEKLQQPLRGAPVDSWPFNASVEMPAFDPAVAGVVRITHQSWKTPELPPRFRRWSSSFTACHPKWQRHLWTDKDNELLVVKYFPWFLPTYHKLTSPIMKVDAARLLYMYKYGGVYCDLDCECLQPFEHLLVNVSLAFGAMEGHTIGKEDGRYVEEGQIENSFMYSVPGHPFIMQLIRDIATKSISGGPEEITGPYLIMRAIHQVRKSKEGFPKEFQGRKYLEIFPHGYFNPFSWITNNVTACKDKGAFSRDDENACRAAHRNSSYILQYHTQVWLAGYEHVNKN